jgi:hypothetical protein
MDNKAEILALLKSLLGIEVLDTSRDVELNAYINGAISICETYLDDVLDRRNVAERLAYAKFPKILRFRNAGELVSADLDGTDVSANWEIIAQDAYAKLQSTTGSYEVEGQVLTVTYPAGFTTLPYDLMLAVRDVAAVLESKTGAGAPSMGRIQRENIVGIGSVDYQIDAPGASSVGVIPAAAVQILNMYRRSRI